MKNQINKALRVVPMSKPMPNQTVEDVGLFDVNGDPVTLGDGNVVPAVPTVDGKVLTSNDDGFATWEDPEEDGRFPEVPEEDGKVLTSNDNGEASWEDPVSEIPEPPSEGTFVLTSTEGVLSWETDGGVA